jgi:hypothetical protein
MLNFKYFIVINHEVFFQSLETVHLTIELLSPLLIFNFNKILIKFYYAFLNNPEF